jgi:hypothetical protein
MQTQIQLCLSPVGHWPKDSSSLLIYPQLMSHMFTWVLNTTGGCGAAAHLSVHLGADALTALSHASSP